MKVLVMMLYATFSLAQTSPAGTAPATAPQTPGAPTASKPAGVPAAVVSPAPTPLREPMVKPSAEMNKLVEKLIGSPSGMGMQFAAYMTDETWAPGPGVPNGSTTHGRENIRLGPERLSIIFDYMQLPQPDSRFSPMSGHGIISWNPATKRFESAWTDTMMPGIELATGNWQDDKLVMAGSMVMDGKPLTTRETYSDFTDGGFTFTIEAMEPSGKSTSIGTMKYSKAKMMTPRPMPPGGMPKLGAPEETPQGAPPPRPNAPKAAPAAGSNPPAAVATPPKL